MSLSCVALSALLLMCCPEAGPLPGGSPPAVVECANCLTLYGTLASQLIYAARGSCCVLPAAAAASLEAVCTFCGNSSGCGFQTGQCYSGDEGVFCL